MTLYTEHEDDENDGYATKPSLWRPLSQAAGGFDVDPASGVENEHIADTVYTKEENGLTKSWDGTVWLNPPFSQKLEFFKKAVNEYNCGNADRIIALAPVDTSTQWFQNWYSKADVICWLEGRDWYESTGSPSFNTAVAVWNPNNEVIRVLRGKGTVTQALEDKQTTL